MQNGPSQVSSGNIAPKIVGPQTGSKEVLLFVGLGLCLGGVLIAAWYYGQYSTEPMITPITAKVENPSVPEIIKQPSAFGHTDASVTKSLPITAPVIAPLNDIIHADVYFEVGRKGLTEEAKAQLAAQAEFLKQHEEYGILIQGYTDQQGSATYNKKLGMKRAETVKEELLRAGISEHRIAVVSLGEEGVLCMDNSEVCRHINRRTHLEIQKIGLEHMATPAVAATSTNPAKAGVDASPLEHEAGLGTEDLQPLNPEPVSGS
jgi:peptidoglycan-associated lipoprotein